MRNIAIFFILVLSVVTWLALGWIVYPEVKSLTRSHAVMWERQERLKQITCGYCHHKVPDWCDKHDGVK